MFAEWKRILLLKTGMGRSRSENTLARGRGNSRVTSTGKKLMKRKKNRSMSLPWEHRRARTTQESQEGQVYIGGDIGGVGLHWRVVSVLEEI